MTRVWERLRRSTSAGALFYLIISELYSNLCMHILRQFMTVLIVAILYVAFEIFVKNKFYELCNMCVSFIHFLHYMHSFYTPFLYPILLYTVPNLIFNIYKNRFAQVFRRLFLGIPSCGLFIEIGRIGFKQWSNVFFFRAFRSSNKMSMVHILYPSREILEAQSFAQTWSLTNWELAETPRSREMFTATYTLSIQ